MAQIEEEELDITLVSGTPEALEAGNHAVLLIRYKGKPHGGEDGKHGVEILRVLKTSEHIFGWFKRWSDDMSLKVKFNRSDGAGIGSKTSAVDSADPTERELARRRKEADDERRAEARKRPSLRDRVTPLKQPSLLDISNDDD